MNPDQDQGTDRRPSRKRWWLPVLILLLAGAAAAALIATKPKPRPVAVAERAWLVGTTKAVAGASYPQCHALWPGRIPLVQ